MTTHLEDYLSNPNDTNKELALIELAGLFNNAYAEAVEENPDKAIGPDDYTEKVISRTRDKYDELITRMSQEQFVNLEALCVDLHDRGAFKEIPGDFKHVRQCGALTTSVVYIYSRVERRAQDEIDALIQERRLSEGDRYFCDEKIINEAFVSSELFKNAYITMRENNISAKYGREYLLESQGQAQCEPEKLAQAVIKMGCVGQKTYDFLENNPNLFEEIVETEQKLSTLYQMTQSYQEFCKEKLGALSDKTTKKALHLKDKIDVLDDIKKVITDPKKHTAEKIGALNGVSNSKESNKLNEDSAGLGILHFIRNLLPFFKRFFRTKGQEVQSVLESTLKRKNTVTLFKDVLDQQAERALDLEEDILVDPPTLAVMALNA
ncbi:hypothetical protein Psal006b_00755 [Piscirickettsia salmonis]|uniref:Zinc protease n=1 Tax=Piscirickettsia salmonis TaxID=1238 RepID=A0A1L6TDU9_PISSA|nr:hypothetical protein [Piscirickettsia salmonis]AKP74623.1 hypothetical protein PSLF89_3117 [Piscirickettsia salmonis LF-89 = ATCC VR-1361]ALB23625.1 zinc protease [Piscirickettsia salmonis]ALY03490.1 hypothetical protein AWE47_12020 [Piscirickettsia salmonis]AMA43055.1 hypothetical protein AWJ11_12250 [Piscirickettsia salmonis]AOS35524.1 hypothetical protein AVM72_09375 [Piscirickettsia salmonis]